MVRIRTATEDDFPTMLDIQRRAFAEYEGTYKTSGWTTETMDDVRRDAEDKKILIAEWGDVIAGSVRYWIIGGVCVIRLLSVDPAHQGYGIGKALMRAIEERVVGAHKFYVCTMLRTARNIALFLGLGYRPESLWPDHYNHMDMICFSKYPLRP